MGRPKRNQAPSQPSETNAEMVPPTERVDAPETVPAEVPQIQQPPVYTPPPAYQMQVERAGNTGAPVSRRFPEIRGGVCEKCGVLDPNVPSQYQYKFCPHFRGMQLACSYCPAHSNPDDVIYHEKMIVAEHPYQPGKLVVVCTRFDCVKKHRERFELNTA